jgi:hypothetical protein
MQVSSRSTGAGIGTLGAVLVLCGTFLPTYGSGDYEPAGFRNAAVFLLAVLVAPALLVLVSSVFAWFRPLPRWLVVLCVAIAILACVLHLLGSLLGSALACFDMCPLGGVHFGTGFWLPLVGFPVSAIGLAVVDAAEKRRSLPGPPAASP